MSEILRDLVTQQLYQPKNKIIDRIGKQSVVCPQSEEILNKTLNDIELFKDFYSLRPPEVFVKKICEKWGKSEEFTANTLKFIEEQLSLIGYSSKSIKLCEDETSFIFIISGLLKHLRFEAAKNCINYLSNRLNSPQRVLSEKIQRDFSIIPNLFAFFELYKIQGINPPDYILSHEISRLKLSIWTGTAG